MTAGQKPLSFFLELLTKVRTEILEKFILPELGVSYWKFVIGLALAAVVITVLVNVVRIGTVNYSFSKGEKKQKHNESGSVSQSRAMAQRNSAGSVSSSNRSGGYRSKPPQTKQPIFDRQGRRVQ